MHPEFADRGLVEQVLGELGVGPNSEPAAIPTEDFGDVAVRGAREALSMRTMTMYESVSDTALVFFEKVDLLCVQVASGMQSSGSVLFGPVCF